MKSQQGFVIMGGLYFLIGALLIGGAAATDYALTKDQDSAATAEMESVTRAESSAATATDMKVALRTAATQTASDEPWASR